MRNIFCEFEISTYNILCSRGPTKVLALSQINVPGGDLVFQNEAKNIPRQDFMVMNMSHFRRPKVTLKTIAKVNKLDAGTPSCTQPPKPFSIVSM